MTRHILKLFSVFVLVHIGCDGFSFAIGRFTELTIWAAVLLILVVSGVVTLIAEKQEGWK